MNKGMKLLTLLVVSTMLFMVGCDKKDDNAKNVTDDSVLATELSLDYSKGLNDKGYYEGVTSSEYVEIINFDSIIVPKSIYMVTEEKIQEGIIEILQEYATYTQANHRAVENGDRVNIDYIGTIDGVEFENGSTGGAGDDVIIGTTDYIDGFVDQLIGYEPGDIVNVEITFAANHQDPTLRGKNAIYATTINYIEDTHLPELTDEFVVENLSEAFDINTVAELEENLRDFYTIEDTSNYIYNVIMESVVIKSMPDAAINYENMIDGNERRKEAFNAKMALNDYLAKANLENIEAYYELARSYIEPLAVTGLINQAIAEQLNLVITEEDVQDYFFDLGGNGEYDEVVNNLGMPFVLKNLLLEVSISELVETVEYEQ